MMKKWWLVVVVLTCALSLTSCSKKKATGTLQSGDAAFTQCYDSGVQGVPSMGDFDVRVYHSKAAPNMYDMYISPVQLDAPGDIASITIATSSGAFRQVVPQVVLNLGQAIYVGPLTEADIVNYEILAITPFDGTTNFAYQTPVKQTFCQYMVPADVQGN